MTIKWENPPIASSRKKRSLGKMQLFISELSKNPHAWGIYRSDLAYGSATSAVTALKRQGHGEVDAVVRNGTVYARWVGEEATR